MSLTVTMRRAVKQTFPWLPARLVAIDQRLRARSIRAALRGAGLSRLHDRLLMIVPDIGGQYSQFEVNTDYLRLNVRALHAFQMSLVDSALSLIGPRTSPLTVVDIGDSAGTHLQYLQGMHPELPVRCISTNLDEAAVERVRTKGLEAIAARAEALMGLGIDADLFLLFETLEHLNAPIDFLRSLSLHSRCEALVLSVPYVARSRVGLHHIREGRRGEVTPENTHVFELSPGDWMLLAQHAGWAVHYERTFRQYPPTGALRLMKWWWRRKDFEGFWGAVLVRDRTWADRYRE